MRVRGGAKKTFYSAFIDRGHGLDSRAEDEEITISFFFRTDLISQGETSIPQTSLRFYKGGFGYQEYLGTRLFDSSCRKL